MVEFSKAYWNFVDQYRSHLIKDFQLSEANLVELKYRRLSYYFFLCFVIFIGFPVWYFTTTPYRAALPYFDKEFCKNFNLTFVAEGLTPEPTEYNSMEGNVWNQMTLSSRYNVHIIFVHSTALSPLNKLGSSNKLWLLNSLRKYAAIFDQSLEIEFSNEHFWDFSLAEFLEKFHSYNSHKNVLSFDNGKTTLTIDNDVIPALTNEIDRYSTPLIGSEPLIKIVVFLPDDSERISLLDENSQTSKGLVVASWGGFVVHQVEAKQISESNNKPLDLLNAVFGVLRIELGIVTARQRVEKSKLAKTLLLKSPKLTTFQKDAFFHKLQLSVESLSQTIHFVNSLHDLAAKIEDLVISDEVAKLADIAYKNFFIGYDELIVRQKIDFDSLASIRAANFAKEANNHPTLLEFLNFPSDQKYGIYVPLFFPVLVPMFFPLVTLIMFLIRKTLRRKVSSTINEANKTNNEASSSKKDN